MKKIVLSLIVLIISIVPVFSQRSGFNGPGRSSDMLWSNPRVNLTVDQAKQQNDDTRCMLRGRILRQINKDEYEFADDTGIIEIEIERHCWETFAGEVGPDDIVFIYGEVDVDRNEVTFDVREITRAQ